MNALSKRYFLICSSKRIRKHSNILPFSTMKLLGYSRFEIVMKGSQYTWFTFDNVYFSLKVIKGGGLNLSNQIHGSCVIIEN